MAMWKRSQSSRTFCVFSDAEPFGGIVLTIEKVRLVAIQRLVEKRDVVRGGVLAEIIERLAQPRQRLLA